MFILKRGHRRLLSPLLRSHGGGGIGRGVLLGGFLSIGAHHGIDLVDLGECAVQRDQDDESCQQQREVIVAEKGHVVLCVHQIICRYGRDLVRGIRFSHSAMRASKRPKIQHRVVDDDDYQRGVECLRGEIDTWSMESMVHHVEEIEKRWGVDEASQLFGAGRVALVCDALKSELSAVPDIATGPRPESFNISTTGLRVRRELDIVRLSMIRARCQAEESPTEGPHNDLLHRISRLQECVHYVWLACIALNRVALTAHTKYAPMMNDDDSLMRFETLASVDGQDLSPLHQVVLYVTEHIRLNNYRRCGEDCYAMVPTSDNRPTRAWKRVHSVRDLVLRLTTQDVGMTQMRNVLSRGDVIPNAVSYLTEVANWRFPDLTRDRRLMAFSDGLYLTASSAAGEIVDKFFPPRRRGAGHRHRRGGGGLPHLRDALPTRGARELGVAAHPHSAPRRHHRGPTDG